MGIIKVAKSSIIQHSQTHIHYQKHLSVIPKNQNTPKTFKILRFLCQHQRNNNSGLVIKQDNNLQIYIFLLSYNNNQSSSRLMESLNLPYKIFFKAAICASMDSFSSSSFSKFLSVAAFISSILFSTSSRGTCAKTSPIWKRTTSSSVSINSFPASSRFSFVSCKKIGMMMNMMKRNLVNLELCINYIL